MLLTNHSKLLPWLSVSVLLLLWLSLFHPSLCALPPTGSSADSAARPHSVGSGQAPRGMTSLLQMNLKAVEMRKGHNMLVLQILSAWIGALWKIMTGKRKKKKKKSMSGWADCLCVCFLPVVCEGCFFYICATQLDVAIDGADEVDTDLTLIKGGGWVRFSADRQSDSCVSSNICLTSFSLCLSAAASLRRRS